MAVMIPTIQLVGHREREKTKDYLPIKVTTSQPWNLSQAFAIAPRHDLCAFKRSRRTRKDSLICVAVTISLARSMMVDLPHRESSQ